MLKIFLVGQDKKNVIDWKAHGYVICGEADDGELSFPMIKSLKPDIVITDVDMPYVGGLELGKLIKKDMPEVEVIILTENNEFEYAKEAVNAGFFGYLLKPVSEEELFGIIDSAALEIENKHKERKLQEEYIKRHEDDVYNEKLDLFKCMFTASKPVADIIETAGELGITLSSMWYSVSFIYLKHTGGVNEAIGGAVNIMGTDIGCLVFDIYFDIKAIVFRADSKEELDNMQDDFFGKFKNFMKEYSHVRYYGGVGTPTGRISELPESVRKAEQALAHSYIIGDNLILNSEDARQSVYLKREESSIRDINPREIDRSYILEFLRFGNQDKTEEFVYELFDSLGEDSMELNIFRQYVLVSIYFCVGDFLEGIKLDRNDIEPPDTAADTMRSRDNVTKYVIKIINHALKLKEEASGGKYNDIVNEAMRYIEKNYSDEKLSLNLLASHVNFSPNHLSMIFSQQTGHTFIKYLTDFRMNKAKELLMYTSKRSSEISMEVGYKDPHYFSYLFKKTQGMTPTQYRGGFSGTKKMTE